jgi:hypothetical protein
MAAPRRLYPVRRGVEDDEDLAAPSLKVKLANRELSGQLCERPRILLVVLDDEPEGRFHRGKPHSDWRSAGRSRVAVGPAPVGCGPCGGGAIGTNTMAATESVQRCHAG